MTESYESSACQRGVGGFFCFRRASNATLGNINESVTSASSDLGFLEGAAMFNLVERCLADETEAWDEFGQMIFGAAATRRVRRVLTRRGFDFRDVDDVAIELFIHFKEDDYKRLRSFRGSSLQEFAAWLATVAHNFACHWVDKRARAIRREHEALHELHPADRSGATERDVRAWIEEVSGTAPAQDVERLRILCGEAPEPDAAQRGFQGSVKTPTERTIRRWSSTLQSKYRDSGW